MVHKKRIVMIVVLIAVLLGVFWLGSRYPAIDEKAAMAGQAVLGDVLSFEAEFQSETGDPLWLKISRSTLNWVLTNRQGMTFGVLLATLILTLLQTIPRKQTPRRTFRDTLKGVLIGAPLGVCVNCAAPIAYGMHKEGVRNETSLAVMFASPTLNIIVLAMMFSILPLYLALTKLVVTLIFLLVLLPLLLRFFFRESTRGDDLAAVADLPAEETNAEGWKVALLGLSRDLSGNFLFIVIRTVPLMFLAGLLGAAMAHLLPLDSFASWPLTLAAMGTVALLGTFAPVPIAFDVVLVQALLVAGLPPQFAAVLLITLGMFSIYPLMLVAKMMTARFSLVLFASVAVLGVATGYFTGFYGDYRAVRDQAVFEAHFAGRDLTTELDHQQFGDEAPVTATMAESQPQVETERIFTEGKLMIDQAAFLPLSPLSLLPFAMHSGRDYGLAPLDAQVLDLMVPFSQGRGIASADIDDDGWPDLALAENTGVRLMRNVKGRTFEPVELKLPQLEGISSLVVAFVDIDNNGCHDLFVGAFGDADYFVINDCQGFKNPRLIEVPHEKGLMTQAAAFYDTDADGDLDWIRGNWFFLIPRIAPSARAINYLVENQGEGIFRQSELEEIIGETLTVLLSDFNGDGHADLVIGNDFQEPDFYYQGTAKGRFSKVSSGSIVPVSTLATMSIDTADIDNDLDLDMFLSGKVNDFSMRTGLGQGRRFRLQRRKAYQQDYCAQFSADQDSKRCTANFISHDLFRHSRLEDCSRFTTRRQQDECMITLSIKNALIRRDWTFCRQIDAEAFPIHKQVCDSYAAYDAVAQSKVPGYRYLDQGAIDQKDQGNVLLLQQEDGEFIDQAQATGVEDAFWAWNAKFADLDHDEWQDLYVANGWWLETTLYSNAFFRNIMGERFESQEKEFGLVNNEKQCCYTLLDLDRDGDLDIISRSLDGTSTVFINANQNRNAVQFEFRDELANTFGIGNRITIFYGENNARHQLREIKSGGGFASFDGPVAHFGLGDYDRISRVHIRWSDGEQSEFNQEFSSGKRYVVSRRR